MRGKSLTCRHENLLDRSLTRLSGHRPLDLESFSRQVRDLPRIRVAEPLAHRCKDSQLVIDRYALADTIRSNLVIVRASE